MVKPAALKKVTAKGVKTLKDTKTKKVTKIKKVKALKAVKTIMINSRTYQIPDGWSISIKL